jgi:tripartite-type tricarboxylate transporter receptor subunit TctC
LQGASKSARITGNLGADPVGSSPEQFGAFIKAELAKWAKVVRSSGIELAP